MNFEKNIFYNSDKRFSLEMLDYINKNLSKPKEMMVDYDNDCHIYVKSKDGQQIIPVTKSLSDKINEFINNASDIIDVDIDGIASGKLEYVLNELKMYIDSSIAGLSVREPAKALSDEDISPLFGVPYKNIDGVNIGVGDTILLINQNDKRQNGKWIVLSDNWVRSPDFDSYSDFEKSPFIFIQEGEKYGDTGWVLSTDGEIIVGETELDFKIFSRAEDIKAGEGLQKNGNIISLDPISDENKTGTKVTYDIYGRAINIQTPESYIDLGLKDVAPLSHLQNENGHLIANEDRAGFISSKDYIDLKNVEPRLDQLEIDLMTEINTKSSIDVMADIDNIDIDLNGNDIIIADDLTTDSSDVALSAKQGKRLYDIIHNLFTNNNPDNNFLLNIWAGTQSQYESLSNIDDNTIYYVYENESEVINTGSSMDPEIIDKIMTSIEELNNNKANKSGDTFIGDVVFNGEIIYSNKKLSEIIDEHTHEISSVINLQNELDNKSDITHIHNLSDLISDENHRTVTDEQIESWSSGEDIRTSISEHNTSNESHEDIRQMITDLSDTIYSDPVKLDIYMEKHILSEGDNIINIEYDDYDKNKHTIMLYANSVFINSDRYTINDRVISLNNDELPITKQTEFNIIFFKATGLLIGNIEVGSITKDKLSDELIEEINNKSDITHSHLTSEIIELDRFIESTELHIDDLYNTKVDKIEGKGLSTNDFTDDYKNKIDNINDSILENDEILSNKINGKGLLYTELNIRDLNIPLPNTLENICIAMEDDSILSCDAWIVNEDDRPTIYGHLFIMKSNKNRVFINFYRVFEDNNYEIYYKTYSGNNEPIMSEWYQSITSININYKVEKIIEKYLSEHDISGGNENQGGIFIPHVEDNILSWTNNAGLENPEPVDLTANISFATFEINFDNGRLIMNTPDKYSGPSFKINEKGLLEVII